jgi:hypothetical protein
MAPVPQPLRDNITLGIAILGAVSGLFGMFLGIYNARLARRAAKARKRQEAPFFMHEELLVLYQYEPDNRSEFNYCPGDGDVPEDYPDGEPVLLRAYNHGGEARLVEVKDAKGQPCKGAEYRKLNEGLPKLHVYYRYSKARRGKLERFRVCYETVSGEKGEQVFEHPHGLKGLKRVEIK